VRCSTQKDPVPKLFANLADDAKDGNDDDDEDDDDDDSECLKKQNASHTRSLVISNVI
jgi:hypothetical protein